MNNINFQVKAFNELKHGLSESMQEQIRDMENRFGEGMGIMGKHVHNELTKEFAIFSASLESFINGLTGADTDSSATLQALYEHMEKLREEYEAINNQVIAQKEEEKRKAEEVKAKEIETKDAIIDKTEEVKDTTIENLAEQGEAQDEYHEGIIEGSDDVKDVVINNILDIKNRTVDNLTFMTEFTDKFIESLQKAVEELNGLLQAISQIEGASITINTPNTGGGMFGGGMGSIASFAQGGIAGGISGGARGSSSQSQAWSQGRGASMSAPPGHGLAYIASGERVLSLQQTKSYEEQVRLMGEFNRNMAMMLNQMSPMEIAQWQKGQNAKINQMHSDFQKAMFGTPFAAANNIANQIKDGMESKTRKDMANIGMNKIDIKIDKLLNVEGSVDNKNLQQIIDISSAVAQNMVDGLRSEIPKLMNQHTNFRGSQDGVGFKR